MEADAPSAANADVHLSPSQAFDLIARSAPLHIWTIDRELRVSAGFSDSSKSTYLKAAGACGKTLYEFFQTDDPDFLPIAQHIRALAGESVEFEFEYAGCTFHNHLEPMRTPEGEVTGVIGVASDVTARRQAETMLRKSEERNRELIENASDIIYTHDLAGNFTAVSPAAEQITGYSREEALKLNVVDVVVPEAVEEVRKTLASKVTGVDVTGPHELAIRSKAGKKIILEVNTRPILRDGQPVGLQGIARDITARKIAEKALRESESRFRTLTGTAPSAIFIYQGERFRYVNGTTVQMSGYSSAELMEMTFLEMVHPDHREMVKQRAIARQSGQSVPERYEFKIITKNGEERWLDFSAGIIEFEGQLAVLGTAFDITERKRTEEELQVQGAYLEELFQSAPEGIVVLNNQGIILRANREFIRMFGYAQNEACGAPIDDLIVPPEEQEAAKDLSVCIETGKPFNVQAVRRRKNGVLLDVSILGAPISVTRGQIGHYVIYRDITDERRSERYRETQFATTRVLAESTSLSKAAPRLIEAIGGGLGWDFVRMWRVRRATRKLALDATWASSQFAGSALVELPERPNSIVGNICKSGDAAWITDIASESAMPDEAAVRSGLRSCFAVPVCVGKDVRGVLEFYSLTLRYPDFQLLKMMSDIGAQIGQFIERTRTEQKLIESESKFRAVADTAASAIYISAGERFLYANRASELISGYTHEELLSMEVTQLAHPEFRDELRERAAARQRGEEVPARYEFKMLTKSGEVRWLDFSAAVVRFEGQSAILASAFDITERKRAELLQSALYEIANLASAAEDLNELYAKIHQIVGKLMNAQNFYIAVLDEETQLIHFPYFVDMEDPEPPPPQECLGGLTHYVLKTGRPLLVDPIKFEAMAAEGLVESRGSPSIDWLGVPLKVGDHTFGVLTVQSYTENVRFSPQDHDILTFVSQQVASAIEHRRSQDALRRSEMRYRSQVQSAVFGIYRSSVEGHFLDVNPALVDMLGYDSAEELTAIDMENDLYATPGERRAILTELGKVSRIEGVEARWRRKDGRVITVRLSGRCGVQNPGEPESFEMIAEDITDRRALEDQLRHSQKMEAVGRLAGGVAHDFNNLLTVIKGYSDLILNELEANDPMHHEINEVRKAADRAASLTRQLLAFSRRQVMEPKVLDLNAIVSNMEKLLRRLLGEDVELLIALNPKIGHIKADPGQIEQVIMNLAVNARDAMPRGGSLTLETSDIFADDLYARENLLPKAGRYVVLSVADKGVGMTADTVSHIFEPFFTTKETGKGTGLGLSTAYGIVKQSGGHIWVDSEPGIGTTFCVYLPAVEQRAAIAERRVQPTATYRGTENILLVEDEDGVRALVKEVLQRHGYNVVETRGGGEALLACEQRGDEIQMLLTDVVLPQMSGRELAERLSVLRPNMKVLFVSGYTEEAIIQQGVLGTGKAFLQKPFTPTALARKVREVLDGMAE